ncbi:glycosyltransferase family protein [Pedobacter agri]|uniref:hypothetical protein n=1 Tax=Pedobacter agri TaxID=454586 RepID=UPI00292ED744|nr:hypothetical protein [Pedobacter agri]
MSVKKITLVSTSHLSSNPRLVKEAKALSEADFVVNVIFLQHIHELESFDEEIIQYLPLIKFYSINFGSKNIASKCLNWKRLLRKLWIKINSKSELIENIFFPEFKKVINKINTDLYIGHTLQALPIVALAANNQGTKFAFDAEDYHRGETSDDKQNNYAAALENKYLNEAEYISTASEFISDAYHKHFELIKIITLNNFFTYNDLEPLDKIENNQPIKIVWFSQTIGLNRGLKEFITKLILLNSNLFELHLRGTSDEFIQSKLLENVSASWKDKIFFYPQCNPKELSLWLQGFDIGLALEPGFSFNNEIAISNKIFQYFNAGLAVVATSTIGQKWVIQQAPNAGIILSRDLNLDILKNWSENREKLDYAKEAAQNAAKQIFDWNDEKKKLIDIVRQIKVD